MHVKNSVDNIETSDSSSVESILNELQKLTGNTIDNRFNLMNDNLDLTKIDLPNWNAESCGILCYNDNYCKNSVSYFNSVSVQFMNGYHGCNECVMEGMYLCVCVCVCEFICVWCCFVLFCLDLCECKKA